MSFGGEQDHNGLVAQAAIVKGRLVWGSVGINNHTEVDLRDVRVGSLVLENEAPRTGKFIIRGLTYDSIEYEGTVNAALRWLDLQPFFSSQPYQQLAKALRERGNEKDARAVLIEKEKALSRRGNLGLWAQIWSWVLKASIGYGYRPQRALYWGLVVVAFGALFVYGGQTASLMKQTRPEATSYEPLSPIIYSLDVFLPIVNLRQKDHWWPVASKECRSTVLGDDLTWPCGLLLRAYLWGQILAGWVLTTLFAAGLAGLVRKD
jgi:hypothetical protein